MKVKLCDICKKPLENKSYKIKIKKEKCSWYETWWEKLDVCSKCGDLLFSWVNNVKLREEMKK